MKPRRVMVMIEMETVEPLSDLRSEKRWQAIVDTAASWEHLDDCMAIIAQVQANVIRRPAKKRKAK